MARGLTAVALACAIGGGSELAAAADAPSGELVVAERPQQGCEAFTWPIDREQAWFNDAHLARRDPGARLSHIDRAVELALAPMSKAHFFMPPERPIGAEGYRGEAVVRGVPRPAVYQVTVSEDASFDLFEIWRPPEADRRNRRARLRRRAPQRPLSPRARRSRVDRAERRAESFE